MDEEELIQQLKQGQEPAFRWLVDNYRNGVYCTVLNILQDPQEAEDCTQETFIQVFESINGFRGAASLATWINRIAVHKGLGKIRKQKIRNRLHAILPWWMPEEKKSSEAAFQHPGISLEQKEKAAILFKAIATLPEKQRLAFTLVKVQGMSYDEVCMIMQQNIKAVESLVNRAKMHLQKKLENNSGTLK